MRPTLKSLQRCIEPRRPILLILPAIGLLGWRLTGVTGLTLQQSEMTAPFLPATISGTVVTDAPPGSSSTEVYLSSSNTVIATVPSSVVVSGKTGSATFDVSVAALRAGCTTVAARVASETPRRVTLYVRPGPDQDLTSLTAFSNPVSGGQFTAVRVYDGPYLEGPSSLLPSKSLSLSSSSRVATVPSSVTLNRVEVTPSSGTTLGYAYEGTFKIATLAVSAPTCAIIQAGTTRMLLKINP